MISKSALEALNKLVEKWHAAAKNGMPTYGHALGTDLCADELSAILQSIEPTEARAGEVLPCPFCGAVDTEGRYIEQKFYAPDDQHQERAKYKFVYLRFCNSCGAHGPQGDRSEDDKELWNRRASPLPKAETQPVAWRAWSKPVPGRKWPSDQWVYWDEEPTTIQDDPEFSQFQALYAHPAPEAATIDAAIASEVMRAIRTVKQDVRPYMRHLEDCELVRFRQGYYSPSETKCPPCSCGLEKVLWDIPAEIETGKTK